MPQPGSHKYDIRRTRLRSELDDAGVNDQKADAEANRILQEEQGNTPRVATERGLGPKGER